MRFFLLIYTVLVSNVFALGQKPYSEKSPFIEKVTHTLKENTLLNANWALTQKPITVTTEQCERSGRSAQPSSCSSQSTCSCRARRPLHCRL